MVKICYDKKSRVLKYAAEEFSRLTTAVSGIEPEILGIDSADEISGGIVLATFDFIGKENPDIRDPLLEDAWSIEISNLSGYVTGSNERSVLIGVYRYFHGAGCRFLRPGKDGEYLPECDLENFSYNFYEKADCMFRGECCEGAISYEHMRDMVYWMPKVGMNLYMIEGIVPYTYMHKWYGHIGNTRLHPKGYITDYDMLEEYVSLLEQDIKKTGVQLHALGHGWMFDKLGIKHTYGKAESAQLKEEDRKYIALVNGKRDLFRDSQGMVSTFYTHFCYSNPEARKILCDFVVEYLEKKPWIDFLHIWLADARNNQCECEECVKMTPTDHYVRLLNEIDEALAKKSIETRLVLITYADTVRPPVQMKLRNPKRFLLCSVLGNNYEQGYKKLPFDGNEPPFVLNKWKKPKRALLLHWVSQWKERCGNMPSFVFEYRFYTDHYSDPGYMQISRESLRDMNGLKEIGMQGIMDDQTPRCFMPTSLPMLVRAEALIHTDMDFEDFCNDYFSAAFGDDGEKVRSYLETLSTLFQPSLLRTQKINGDDPIFIADNADNGDGWVNNEEYAAALTKMLEEVKNFIPFTEMHFETENTCRRKNWIYLNYHSRLVMRLTDVILAGAEGNMAEARAKYIEMEDWLSSVEMDIHEVFDLFLFSKFYRHKLGLPRVAYFD